MARIEAVDTERPASHRAQTLVLHVGCQYRASEEAKPDVPRSGHLARGSPPVPSSSETPSNTAPHTSTDALTRYRYHSPLAHEDVAQHAAADAGERAEDYGVDDAEAMCQRGGCAGHAEQREPGGVECIDRALEAVDRGMRERRNEPGDAATAR
jgi:hypothetical protein